MAILKVFVGKPDVASVLEHSKLIERYDAFVLVEANEEARRQIARRFPIEDISAQYQMNLGGRAVKTRTARPSAAAGRPDAGLSPGPHHYVVQFKGPIKRSWLTAVTATGAKLRSPYGNFGYVVWARESSLAKIRALKSVRWVGHLPHRDRIAPGLVAPAPGQPVLRRRIVRSGVYTIDLFDAGDTGRILRASRVLGFRVLSKDAKAGLIMVESVASDAARRKQLQALSAVHGVRYLRERVLARTCNDIATGIMGNAFAAVIPAGLKLTGNGETVAVCDTGLDTGSPADIHPDFAGRIVAIKSYPITPDWNSLITNPGGDDGPADLDSGHGTHVAGSILGDGTASAGGPAVIRGHGHKAKLVFQAIEQEMKWRPNAPPRFTSKRYLLAGIPTNLSPLFQFAYSQGARIHSNSWGGGDPGAYDSQCRQFDAFVWSHKDFCFVIAAGNDGSDEDADGRINPMSVTSPGTAKNCITVGACENLRPGFNAEKYGSWWPTSFPVAPFATDPMANNADQLVAFSSRGPTADGRIKPDVVAPGTFILSTRSTRLAPNNFAWGAYPPNKKYFHMGGTSMATPLTSGALAVLREFLRTKRAIASPSAALLKALLIAGAQRLPGTAPAGTLGDHHQGYGRVNLDGALKRPLATIEGAGLATGQQATHTIVVPTASNTFRIVLAYSDFPGPALVNNLNLIVADPAGRRYIGNQSPAAGNALTLDTTNNVEVIHASNAKKGNWTVNVVGSNVSSGPQDYALAAVLV
jgi:hypothetical protein